MFGTRIIHTLKQWFRPAPADVLPQKEGEQKTETASVSPYVISDTNVGFFKTESEFMMDFSPDRYGAVEMTSPADWSPAPKDRKGTRRKKQATKKMPIRVPVTPKSVLKELEVRPTMYSTNGLDDKIALLEEKVMLTTQSVAIAELQQLIVLLKNRKKGLTPDSTGQPFNAFFSQFDTTDDAKVQALCTKHGLVKRPADIFIPEFPADATRVMTMYTAKVKELTGLKPRYFVIATPESFKEAYGKRDPILLAQSPFGFYYHILGAWDTEMLYLPEL